MSQNKNVVLQIYFPIRKHSWLNWTGWNCKSIFTIFAADFKAGEVVKCSTCYHLIDYLLTMPFERWGVTWAVGHRVWQPDCWFAECRYELITKETKSKIILPLACALVSKSFFPPSSPRYLLPFWLSTLVAPILGGGYSLYFLLTW